MSSPLDVLESDTSVEETTKALKDMLDEIKKEVAEVTESIRAEAICFKYQKQVAKSDMEEAAKDIALLNDELERQKEFRLDAEALRETAKQALEKQGSLRRLAEEKLRLARAEFERLKTSHSSDTFDDTPNSD